MCLKGVGDHYYLDKPLFLFLDEVQYDESGISTKSIYDRLECFYFPPVQRLLLTTTRYRAAIYEKIYPLSFTSLLKLNI